MNETVKEILNVYEKLDAKGKAAVLRRAKRLLERQRKQIAAVSRNRRQPVQRKGKTLKQPKRILLHDE